MNTLYYIISLAAYWLLAAAFFIVLQKPFFILSNNKKELKHLPDIIAHGAISDAIIASYLCAVPTVLLCACAIYPCAAIKTIFLVYNILSAILIGLITTADACLYHFWHSKIDASVFPYLRHPKGATASVSNAYIASWLGVAAIFSIIYFVATQSLIDFCVNLFSATPSTLSIVLSAVFLPLSIGVLFMIIRGLGIRPHNPSVVYFSKNQFLNHSALNPGYNMIYSLTTKDEFKGKFQYMPQDESQRIVSELFRTDGQPTTKIITNQRPNILLIVWESLGGPFVELLPNLQRLKAEGVYFSDCVAGSFRTDRALVCTLSGFLAQPTTSVIRYTRKLPNLPGLPRTLKKHGYETTAIHGGDLAIMHKSDYYLASGHDTLVSQKDFSAKALKCKWGVHDGEVFDYVFDKLQRDDADGKRHFTTFQTLSSHEPFEVPFNEHDNKILNAFAYTDNAFGRFIDRLKATSAWDNLLIICVADHGLNINGADADHRKYAHIPLLMLGGAAKKGVTIDTLMAQTDIAATLLGQMDIDHADFTYSRDIFAPGYIPSAMHSWPTGFMFADNSGHTEYDIVSDTALSGNDPALISRGRAILQELYRDLAVR